MIRAISAIEKGITLAVLVRVMLLLGHLDAYGALAKDGFSFKDQAGCLGLFVLACILSSRLIYTIDRDWFRKEGYIHGRG